VGPFEGTVHSTVSRSYIKRLVLLLMQLSFLKLGRMTGSRMFRLVRVLASCGGNGFRFKKNKKKEKKNKTS
jgi:hypothetical protein